MNIEIITFDADDTLWYAQRDYEAAEAELVEILAPWENPSGINQILLEIEKINIPFYGYGIKSFVLSMVEAAIKISNGEIQTSAINQILRIGRSMKEQPIILRPHVAETILMLTEQFPLMLITKGDLLDQHDKLNRSGLADHFSLIEVVNEKTSEIYQEVFKKYRINCQSLLMVGNSLKSDILPILELGGTTVHIPDENPWEHELVASFEPPEDGFHVLEHMGQLPELIDQIHTAD